MTNRYFSTSEGRETPCFAKPLLVEFIGPPGAGKSTICRALDELTISCSGVTVLSSHFGFIDKLFRRTRIDYFASIASLRTKYRKSSYVQNGVLEMYLDALRQSESQLHVERMRRKALVRNLVQHLRLRNRRIGGAFVIDEGLAQRGISALLSGVPRGIIEQHYTYMPLADLYVYVDIYPETATARLKQRDGDDWRRVVAEDYQHAIERIQQRGRPILRVSGEGGSHEAAVVVYRELLSQAH